jgi:hypothetical protein
MIFGAGAYPFAGVLRGFISIFGKRFLALNGGEKLRAIALSFLLLITSSGVFFFFLAFLVEYYGQLTCRGAGCAQGGMGVFMFLPVAWFSYAVTRLLCGLFVRRKWWPNGHSPQFP